jgi:hypothetical protein
MDFGKAFSFVFEDEEWLKKIGVAGLIILIPVIGVLVIYGWMVEIVRRVVNGSPEPLPDWSDFGGYLGDGFKTFVIGFVYSLPLLIFNVCIVGSSALMGQSGEDSIVAVVGILTTCISCLMALYGIAVSFVLPAAIGKFAVSDELGAAFRFGEVIRLVRENVGPFALVFLGSLLAGLVASLGTIACVIGVLFTSAYGIAMYGHLVGQAYQVATGGGGGGSVVAPEDEVVPEADF